MAIYERMTLKPRAGALPEYNRQTENYVPGQGVSARVDDSAARIAGAGRECEERGLPRRGKCGLGRHREPGQSVAEVRERGQYGGDIYQGEAFAQRHERHAELGLEPGEGGGEGASFVCRVCG